MIEHALHDRFPGVERVSEGWWEATTIVPAHRFYTWVHQPPGQDAFLMLISRDTNDRQYATDVLTFTAGHLSDLPADRPLSKVTGFAHANYPHDAVCAINGDVHRQLDSDFDRRIRVVFPAYDCEFSGDEDVPTANAQRRLVESIDWRHKLHPKAMAAFPKRPPQGRYKGPKLALYPITTLFWNLKLLPETGKAARLLNYRGESCLLEATAHGYLADVGGGSRALVDASWDAARAWTWEFLAPGRPMRDDLAPA